MKRALTIMHILFSLKGFAQSRLEVGLASIYNKHADYTSRYFNEYYTHDITLSGVSYGLNINYVKPIGKKFNATVGMGYYRLGIDKVTATSSRWGTFHARAIDYRFPSGIQPGVTTDKYFYNNLNFLLGFQYEIKCQKLSYTVGSDINFHYSFSQQYHLRWGEGIKFKTSIQRPFGFGVNSYLGALKLIKQTEFYIHPKIVIPIFQRIKGDRVFGEDERITLDQWFGGFGLSVSFGKYF